MIVYVSIGNSDDHLTQREWALFQIDLQQLLHDAGALFHGEWYSNPNSIFQNACVCMELPDALASGVKQKLIALAGKYVQDSIAWAHAPVTEFLGPS